MAVCAANGCTNKPCKDLEFFDFPENKEQRARWISALQKPDGWQPSVTSKICSVHFVTRLVSPHPWHPDYVPSVFRSLRTKKRDKSSRARQIIEAELGLDEKAGSFSYDERKQQKKMGTPWRASDELSFHGDDSFDTPRMLSSKKKKISDAALLSESKRKLKQLEMSEMDIFDEDRMSVQSGLFDSHDEDSLIEAVAEVKPKRGRGRGRGRGRRGVGGRGASSRDQGNEDGKCRNCQSYIQQIALLQEELNAKKAVAAEWDEMVREKSRLFKMKLNIYKGELQTTKEKIAALQLNEAFFQKSKHRVVMYTGLPNYSILITLFSLVSLAVKNDIHISSITRFQQFILCLMKLRMNLKFKDLANRFAIDFCKIERFFPEWMDALHRQVSHVLVWPPDNVQYRLSVLSQSLKDHYKIIKDVVRVTKFISSDGHLRKNHKIEIVCGALIHISEVAVSDVQDKLPDVLVEKEKIIEDYLKAIGKYVPSCPSISSPDEAQKHESDVEMVEGESIADEPFSTDDALSQDQDMESMHKEESKATNEPAVDPQLDADKTIAASTGNATSEEVPDIGDDSKSSSQTKFSTEGTTGCEVENAESKLGESNAPIPIYPDPSSVVTDPASTSINETLKENASSTEADNEKSQETTEPHEEIAKSDASLICLDVLNETADDAVTIPPVDAVTIPPFDAVANQPVTDETVPPVDAVIIPPVDASLLTASEGDSQHSTPSNAVVGSIGAVDIGSTAQNYANSLADSRETLEIVPPTEDQLSASGAHLDTCVGLEKMDVDLPAAVSEASVIASSAASTMLPHGDLVFSSTDVPSVAADLLSELMGAASSSDHGSTVTEVLLNVATAMAASASSDMDPVTADVLLGSSDPSKMDANVVIGQGDRTDLSLDNVVGNSNCNNPDSTNLEKLHLECQAIHEELLDHIEVLREQLPHSTKLTSFETFEEVVNCLDEQLLSVPKSVASRGLQCWLTLTKLKLNLDDTDLSYSYSISVENVKKIFDDCVRILSKEWKDEEEYDSLVDEILMKEFSYLSRTSDDRSDAALKVCRFINSKANSSLDTTVTENILYSTSFSEVWGSVGQDRSASELQQLLAAELQQLQRIVQQRPVLTEELLSSSHDTFVEYYTGFSDYDSLHDVFNALLPGPKIHSSKSGDLSPYSQFICVLLRLVHNLPKDEILLRLPKAPENDDSVEQLFNNHDPDVEVIISTWLPWIHTQFMQLVTWPAARDDGEEFLRELRSRYRYLASVAPLLRMQAEAVCTALYNAGHHLYCVTSDDEEQGDDRELVEWLF
ncbi:uncharacterized protein LOC108676686 [Hyalella azteca]|uniref:Uncharacterized protein LOC108676686 n=1 Tax=Hyalella azteca TaxID=294128 RepID=A0A8B7P2N6_HYAAZ|nr:uncharacterized protein LOC108676686 [Hyalella azteca]